MSYTQTILHREENYKGKKEKEKRTKIGISSLFPSARLLGGFSTSQRCRWVESENDYSISLECPSPDAHRVKTREEKRGDAKITKSKEVRKKKHTRSKDKRSRGKTRRRVRGDTARYASQRRGKSTTGIRKRKSSHQSMNGNY